MLYSYKINRAIQFSIKTHEIYQKQKRKGKDIPYITHPLTVGIILSRAGADEDVVIAGILHDTIEDSIPEKKVTKEMLAERFGDNVAELVASVSETNKELSWEERKAEALEHIKTFSHQALLVKSADIISNASELVEDHRRDGDAVFERFNAGKEKILQYQLKLIGVIIEKWSDSPLAEDLQKVAGDLQSIGAGTFMSQKPALIIEYEDYSEDMPLECSVCGWKGTPKESGWIEYYDDLLDVSCPNCQKMLLVVGYPLVSKIPEGLVKCEVCGEYKGKVMENDLNWQDGSDEAKREESKEYVTVSCLCDGIPCPKCKKNKIHKPVSNSYDAKTNTIGHAPYFSGMMGCEDCRKKK